VPTAIEFPGKELKTAISKIETVKVGNTVTKLECFPAKGQINPAEGAENSPHDR